MKLIQRALAVRTARRVARKQGLNATNSRPHQLHLWAPLSTSENQYVFPIKAEDQARIAPGVGRGLLDRDAFMAHSMAVGIVPVPVVGGKEIFTAAAPVWFPDPNVFAEAAGAATLSEAQALESIYWGDFSLKTNVGVRIDKHPLLPFRTVQQTQGSATTSNMQNGEEFNEIGAIVKFTGGDENEIIININCQDKTHLAGTADRNNYILIALDGAIIKSSTSKAYLG
ncbi:MAG: hypothetical protein AAF741_15630 [Bacteroidota bacterium]